MDCAGLCWTVFDCARLCWIVPDATQTHAWHARAGMGASMMIADRCVIVFVCISPDNRASIRPPLSFILSTMAPKVKAAVTPKAKAEPKAKAKDHGDKYWMVTASEDHGKLGNALPCLAVPCHALPCLAVPCRAFPCLAVPCRALPRLAAPCRALPCLAVPCRALPCLAVPCRALPCLAVPYSVS